MNKKLTKRELDILIEHFIQDFNYGTGGTWGNGEDYDDENEREEGRILLTKLLEIK